MLKWSPCSAIGEGDIERDWRGEECVRAFSLWWGKDESSLCFFKAREQWGEGFDVNGVRAFWPCAVTVESPASQMHGNQLLITAAISALELIAWKLCSPECTLVRAWPWINCDKTANLKTSNDSLSKWLELKAWPVTCTQHFGVFFSHLLSSPIYYLVLLFYTSRLSHLKSVAKQNNPWHF